MGNVVRRITLIQKDSSGEASVETLYRRKSKRKQSEWARPLEKAQRRSLKASKAYVDDLLDRHERSSGKRRDGWLRDAGVNQMKAARKAFRKLS